MTGLVRVTSPERIAEVAALAREIWAEHYTPIIGQKQVEYMLETFQSGPAISRQLTEGYEYYLSSDEGRNVGYLAVVPDAEGEALMISKIYVLAGERGRGFGRAMLDFAEGICRDRALSAMWLTVNKDNVVTQAWYEGMGFRKTGALIQDIGSGFVMDDYRMEKTVGPD